MAWTNPFRWRDENIRTCWGYTFQLTPDHLSLEQSEPLKHSYDTLADECLDVLNQICPPEARSSIKQAEAPLLHPSDPAPVSLPESKTSQDNPSTPLQNPPTRPKRDLYQILANNHHRHPKLTELWTTVSTPPTWVDWAQIARGQDVFYRYGGATITGLAYQSLLGGMGAARVVETLSRTGGFNVRVARHRLFETTQHILECTQSLESIQPGGAGFASSLRVRLLHAAVRQRILKLCKTRPDYYNVQAYGIPINDLDCIATIASFSSTILFLSLPRQGIFPRQQEIEDYIALWRLVAFYTGTPTEYFATPVKAKAAMESLLMNEVKPSKMSGILANNIIRALENTPPAYASRGFLEVSARWLNGNELCDALNLGRPSLYYWCLMAGQCLFFCAICYTYRAVPYLDRQKITGLRRIFWELIVEGKHGLKGEKTTFEFKYVPDLGKETEDGTKLLEEKKEVRGVERRSLHTLAFAAVGLVVGGYLAVGVARGLLGCVW